MFLEMRIAYNSIEVNKLVQNTSKIIKCISGDFKLNHILFLYEK